MRQDIGSFKCPRALLDLPTELSVGIGRSIVLPKVSAPFGGEEWQAEMNRSMEQLAKEAWGKQEWSRFIFLHTREHRWRALWTVAVALYPSPDLAGLFREVWIDSEDVWRERRVIRQLLRLIAENKKSERRLFTEADRKRFKALKQELTIYRGAKKWNHNGMSWTLDLSRAIYFATHHHHDGMPCSLPPDMMGIVMQKTVRKSAVLFYTNERREDEIVLRRFEKGRISPEGMLWAVADAVGTAKAFGAELKRQREHLPPDVIRQAETLLALMKKGA